MRNGLLIYLFTFGVLAVTASPANAGCKYFAEETAEVQAAWVGAGYDPDSFAPRLQDSSCEKPTCFAVALCEDSGKNNLYKQRVACEAVKGAKGTWVCPTANACNADTNLAFNTSVAMPAVNELPAAKSAVENGGAVDGN